MRNIYLYIMTPLLLLGISYLFIYCNRISVLLPIITCSLFLINMLIIIKNQHLQILKKRFSFGKNPYSSLYVISSLLILSLSILIAMIRESSTNWNGISIIVFWGICFFLMTSIFYNDFLISFRNNRIIIVDNLYSTRLKYNDIKEISIDENHIAIKKINNSVIDVEIQLDQDYIRSLTSFLVAKKVYVSCNICNNV